MQEDWTQEVECLALKTVGRDTRVLGVTSVQQGAGTNLLCERLCEILALGGHNPLFIDLTGTVEGEVPPSAWCPGRNPADASIELSRNRYHRLKARFDRDSRFIFNSPERLRASFEQLLTRYDFLVVELPQIPTKDTSRINGAAVASACKGTVIVVMTGQSTKSEIAAGLDALASGQSELLGFVLNDTHSPTLGAELAREARRLDRWAPKLATRLESWALGSVLLN